MLASPFRVINFHNFVRSDAFEGLEKMDGGSLMKSPGNDAKLFYRQVGDHARNLHRTEVLKKDSLITKHDYSITGLHQILLRALSRICCKSCAGFFFQHPEQDLYGVVNKICAYF